MSEQAASLEVAVTETILNPLTGELVPASDKRAVAEALDALREYKDRVLAAIHQAEAVLLDHSRASGTKTLRMDGVVAEISGGPATDWVDEEGLERELLAAGLPEDRVGALVKTTVSKKVDGRVAKQVEGANPEYARIVARHRVRVEKPWRVSVKRS